MINGLKKKKVLGVALTNASRGEVLEYFNDFLENSTKKAFIVTPNPEILMIANKNSDYKNVLNSADLALVDGVGLMIAARILGDPLKERFSGVDFVEMVCEAVAKRPITVGFLGGRDNVAEEASECLKTRFNGLKVAFAKPFPASEDSASDSFLKSLKCDVLFVALGAPKQENFIYNNLSKLPVRAAMGVGGSFDYISGRVARAPKVLRNLGMEWLFRLIRQPWRIKRQMALIRFVIVILKLKVSEMV